jgi:hypothetical protein
MDFCEYMFAMTNAPFDMNLCGECGGSGGIPELCCNGRECGCMGQPVDFKQCKCGIEPTNKQLKEWAENARV